MKLCVRGFVLAIALAAVAGKAETLNTKAIVNHVSATRPIYVDHCRVIPAFMVTRDVPEPKSVLLLAAGLISLALFTTIGRPPFRLKF